MIKSRGNQRSERTCKSTRAAEGGQGWGAYSARRIPVRQLPERLARIVAFRRGRSGGRVRSPEISSADIPGPFAAQVELTSTALGYAQRARITLLKFVQTSVMASYEIEIILNRQLADCLSLPVFITDPNGDLIFYNEAAEKILGKRFEETGEMPKEIWSTVFKPLDDDGKQLPPEELPLVRTLKDVYPYHKSMRIEGLNGAVHDISVTSYPIISRSGNFLGAVAIFWKRR
jgi:PAS domain-containing protein